MRHSKTQPRWCALEHTSVRSAAALILRQREVTRLLGEAKSDKEIALRLGIAPGTVRPHGAPVLKAMRAKWRKELAH